MNATWDILILTQPSRWPFLAQLLAILEPQVEPRVNVRIHRFDDRLPLGGNREEMRQASRADYLCFVDDDDVLPPDYVARILPLLDGVVDQIGFRLQCHIDGTPFGTTIHSLAAKGWHDDGRLYWRDISHLNPIRRGLALAVPMEGGYGEDHRWADRLRATGLVRSERFVGDVGAIGTARWPLTTVAIAAAPVMYHYLARTHKDDARDAAAAYRLALIERLRAGATPAPRPSPDAPRCER
jgi:glycosyltransferase involved in cell wall biosynthesis